MHDEFDSSRLNDSLNISASQIFETVSRASMSADNSKLNELIGQGFATELGKKQLEGLTVNQSLNGNSVKFELRDQEGKTSRAATTARFMTSIAHQIGAHHARRHPLVNLSTGQETDRTVAFTLPYDTEKFARDFKETAEWMTGHTQDMTAIFAASEMADQIRKPNLGTKIIPEITVHKDGSKAFKINIETNETKVIVPLKLAGLSADPISHFHTSDRRSMGKGVIFQLEGNDAKVAIDTITQTLGRNNIGLAEQKRLDDGGLPGR